MVAAITGFWCRLHTHTPKPPLCGLPLHIHVSTRNGGSKPVGNTKGSNIERSDLRGNIGLLGNVTSDIRYYETSDQVVFLILYFTGGHLTTTATSIDNVGSPEESYIPRSLLNPVSWRDGHMVPAITGFGCRLHSCTPEPSSCGLPLHIHVSTRNGGSKPVGIRKGLIWRGLILEGILVFM
ncbi:hypothetical protein Tco_0106622, partial [Tanacetum coccineum]